MSIPCLPMFPVALLSAGVAWSRTGGGVAISGVGSGISATLPVLRPGAALCSGLTGFLLLPFLLLEACVPRLRNSSLRLAMVFHQVTANNGFATATVGGESGSKDSRKVMSQVGQFSRRQCFRQQLGVSELLAPVSRHAHQKAMMRRHPEIFPAWTLVACRKAPP